MKIVVLDGAIANPGDISWEPLQQLGELVRYPETAPEQLPERIAGAEAVITNKVPLSRQAFQQAPSLRYVGVLATGYNQVDVVAAKEHGVVVCNVPDYSTFSVAQHTIALLLEITNRVGHHSHAVRKGRWAESRCWSFWDHPLAELCGKTMGIIGFGNIGRATGGIAMALGMRVMAAGSRPTEEGRRVAAYVPLEDIWAQADVLSLHCPLLPETKNMIRRENIEKMKHGAILLNTARGGLVAEQDLADALQSGQVAAAGLDVTAKEPLPDDSPLRTAPNCFITPHIAWVAREARQRLFDVTALNLRAFLEGKPQNVVNP